MWEQGKFCRSQEGNTALDRNRSLFLFFLGLLFSLWPVSCLSSCVLCITPDMLLVSEDSAQPPPARLLTALKVGFSSKTTGFCAVTYHETSLSLLPCCFSFSLSPSYHVLTISAFTRSSNSSISTTFCCWNLFPIKEFWIKWWCTTSTSSFLILPALVQSHFN